VIKWRLNENGHYVTAGWLIEHIPARNSQAPYFLYSTSDKYEMIVYKGNFETLDIAKRNAK